MKKLKVLCEWSPGGPHYVRSGWLNAFKACGHQVAFWVPPGHHQGKPAFDALDEYFGGGSPLAHKSPIPIYLGTTYGDRAVWKWLEGRNDIKVGLFASAWGPLTKRIDLKRYPLVVAQEEEKRQIEGLRRQSGGLYPHFVFIHASGPYLKDSLSGWETSLGIPTAGILNGADTTIYAPQGAPDPHLECDLAFCGNLWPYKGRNIEKFIYPLCRPDYGRSLKIFGSARWPVANYLGSLSQKEENALYNSMGAGLSVSEPHSTDHGFDLIERLMKVPACGKIVISDYVEEARSVFSDEEGLALPMARTAKDYEGLIEHVLTMPKEKKNRLEERLFDIVTLEHSYFQRIAQMMSLWGLEEEAQHAQEVGEGYYRSGAEVLLARHAS